MKRVLFGAAALALLAGCGANVPVASPEDVTAALTDMGLASSGSAKVEFASSEVDGGTATYTDISAPISEYSDTRISADRLVLTGVNVTDLGATFSTLTFENILITGEDEPELKIAELTVKNPSPAFAAWISDFVEQVEPDEMPALSDISFDAVSMNGITFTVDSSYDDVSMSLGNISMEDFANGGFDNFSLDNLSFTSSSQWSGETVNATVRSLDINGWKETQTAKLIGMFEVAVEGPEGAIGGMSEFFNNPLDPGFDSVKVTDLDIGYNGVSGSVPSFEMLVEYTRGDQPRSIETRPFTLTLRADRDSEMGAQIMPMLDLVEMETIQITAANKYTIDTDSDRISAKASDNYIRLADVVDLNIGFDVTGMSQYTRAMVGANLTDFGYDGNISEEALKAIQLNGLTIRMDDNGLLDKGLTLAASFSGQEASSLKAQMQGGVALMPAFASEIGIDPTIITELVGPLSSFLSDPGTLTIQLDPETPINSETFSDPSQITKDALGLSVTAD